MPSWRRPRRRLLGWLSNSRKNSGSREANQRNGGRWSAVVFCFRLLVARVVSGAPFKCLVFPGRGRVLGKSGLLGSL